MQLAARVSEGIAVPWFLEQDRNNPAGRLVAISTSGDLAFAAGISAGGLRAAAWWAPERTPANLHTIKQAVRQHLPLVLVAEAAQFKSIAATGAFALFAKTAQELLDFTLIAHRISEQALIPGVVVYQIEGEDQEAEIPGEGAIAEFLGNPDDRISSPSPAQQMLFGKTRRRIPRMFNPDVAVLSGAQKSAAGMAWEEAGQRAYFQAHLQEIIDEAFVAFEKNFGRAYRSFHADDMARAGLLLFGDDVRTAELAPALRSKTRLTAVQLSQWAPMPAALAGMAGNAGRVGVVEHAGGALFSALCEAFAGRPVTLHAARYVGSASKESLQVFVERLEAGTLDAAPFWLDVPFSRGHSEFPKRQVLLQHIRREYPQLEGQSAAGATGRSAQPAAHMPERIPLALRRYQDHGPLYARLSHFFDQTAFFYDTASPDWVADPAQALPVMPPATAGFGQAAAARTHIPELDARACTACGDCFVHCPHAAIPPLALDLEAFIQSGIKQAQAKGQVLAQMIPQAKNLAKAANRVLASFMANSEIAEKGGLTLNGILAPAFEEFVQQAGLEGEKLENITREFQAVSACIGAFRVVIADSFYNQSEQSLFSLAMDPSACTGCGICAEVCQDDALHMAPDTGEAKEAMQQQFDLWERLPDTSADTIQRLLADPHYSSSAALMLSRNFYMSLTGATHADGAPAKAMIHLVTAVAEAAVQPAYRAVIRDIDEKIESISSRLKKDLGEALPDLSPDGLAEKLQYIDSERITIDELLGQSTGGARAKLLDKTAMQRKTDLLKALGDLKNLIESGTSGTGRARYGIALDASLAELAVFPLNSFTVPVVCFDGASVEMAEGLVHAHLRHIIDNIKVLRRATLEADNKYIPAIHDAEIAALQWDDLSEAERSFVPPLLLIGRPALLHHNGAHALTRLMKQGLPIKVIIIDDANPSLATAPADILHAAASILAFIGLRHVLVWQSSLAEPEHLYEGLISALGKPGSAYLRLLAPAATSGNLQGLHELAHHSRAFPHLDYRPDRRGHLLFSKMHIHHNPAPDAEWLSDTLRYSDGGEEKQMPYELTWADWAFAQPDRKPLFIPWQERMGEALPIAAFLRLDAAARKGKTPVIMRIGAQGELLRYAVVEGIAKEAEACLQTWMLWREMAGALAEFPGKVYAKAEAELRVQYEADKQQLVDEYEAKLKKSEQEHLEKVRLQMREKLLQMTAMSREL